MQRRRKDQVERLTHVREGVEVFGHVGHDTSLVRRPRIAQVRDVEQAGNVEVLLGDPESELGVSFSVRLQRVDRRQYESQE